MGLRLGLRLRLRLRLGLGLRSAGTGGGDPSACDLLEIGSGMAVGGRTEEALLQGPNCCEEVRTFGVDGARDNAADCILDLTYQKNGPGASIQYIVHMNRET